MNLENDSYYIYCNYHGDIKELQTQLSKYNVPIEKECQKYFCNYCLRTSYQTNPEASPVAHDLGLSKENIEKMSSKQLKIPINNSASVKPHSITKDWCCPWCINSCFCSRCVRADQIFSLAALYVHYDGELSDLKEYIKRSSSILETLYDYLIPSMIVIKDGMNIVRQNKVHQKYKYKGKDDQETQLKEESFRGAHKSLIDHKQSLLSYKSDLDSTFIYNFQDLKYLDSRIESKINELENKSQAHCLIKRGRGRPKKNCKEDEFKDELSHSIKLLGRKREKESIDDVKKKMSGKELILFSQLQRFKLYDIAVLPSNPNSSGKDTILIRNLQSKIRSLKKRRGRPPGSKNYSSQSQNLK